MRRLEDRPKTGETHLSPLTEDPGRERNRQNSGDLLRWQTGPPSLAIEVVILKDVPVKCPFGAQSLMRMGEIVRDDITTARNGLRS